VVNQFTNWRFTDTGGRTTMYWIIDAGVHSGKLCLYEDSGFDEDSLLAVGDAAVGRHDFHAKNNSGVVGAVTTNDITPGSGTLTITAYILYKDFDITWASLGADDDARNKASQGPIAIVNPECAYADIGEEFTLSAVGSFATYDGSNVPGTIRYPATIADADFTWTPGAGGTVVSGQSSPTAVISYSTAGFRYLLVTITDSNGAAQVRKIPVWVGVTPYPVESVTVPWRIDEDLSIELEFKSPPTFLRHTLVCLVDLDTKECLYLGYAWPASVEYDYEKSTLSLTALQTLSFLKSVFYYPFILTGIKGGAISWDYFDMYSYPRGAYFLLRWHSNFLDIANAQFDVRTTSGPPVSPPGALAAENRLRYIQGFSAGTLYDELKIMAREAFYSIYPLPLGGVEVIPSLLYGSILTGTIPETSVDSDTLTLALTDATMRVPVRKQYTTPSISEVTMWGFYHNAALDVYPIKVKAPIRPEPYGRPDEVPNLLASPIPSQPTDPGYNELLRWAGRHVGLINYGNVHTVRPVPDVNVKTYKMLDVPNPDDPLTPTRIVIEQKTATFYPDGHADIEVVGRDFGVTVSSVVAPVDPVPTTPPTKPPLPVPDTLIADFVGVPTVGYAPLVVAFTDLTTGGTPVSWSWDFGDGNVATTQNPSNTYTAAGLYTVSLFVVADNGASDTATKVEYIEVIASDLIPLTTMCDPAVTVVDANFEYGPGPNEFFSAGDHYAGLHVYTTGTFQLTDSALEAGGTIRVTFENTGATDIQVALSQPYYEYLATCAVIATDGTSFVDFANGATVVVEGTGGDVAGGPVVQFCIRLRTSALGEDLPACSGKITLIEFFPPGGSVWETLWSETP
jgi:PKD repeat protein